MLHSYTRLYVHLVWATKNREKLLNVRIRPIVEKHILGYAKSNGITIEALNVQSEHVHALINLSSDQKVEEIVKLCKGESSHWINSENLIPQKFSWQRGYGTFSVIPSHYQKVISYIKNQDEHHRRITFAEEYRAILRKYGFAYQETDESVWG